MENNKNNQFNYTYSADRQSEIRKIREKYMPKKTDKMEQLRALDKTATKKATSLAVTIGIIGALILGVGMCCCMVWMGKWFIPGIAIGLIGIAAIGAAYPLYSRIAKQERERIAPRILELTEELMK